MWRTAKEIAPLMGAPADFLELVASYGALPARRGEDGVWRFDVDALIDGGWIDPRAARAAAVAARRELARVARGGDRQDG